MKKVLVVAYYFPPVTASGSIRPLGFCRHLEEYGWVPQILTTDPRSVYPPQAWDENMDGDLTTRLRIETVPYVNPLYALIGARDKLLDWFLGARRSQAPEGLNNEDPSSSTGFRRQGRLALLKHVVLDWAFSLPDPQCSWLKPAVRRAVGLSKLEHPELVFATGYPWTALLVGKTLARKLRVPFLADFRDPWARNPYDQFASSFLRRKAKQLERSVCTAADRVITTTEELRSQLLADYPELGAKFLTITNGFDSLEEAPSGTSMKDQILLAGKQEDKKPIELSHFGTVYGKRSPLALFQAVQELLDENRIRNEELRIRFVGGWEVKDERCEALAKGLEEAGILTREKRLPRDVCLREMACSSCLLVLQPSSPLQIPAKIYEYIATGRPLFVVGGEGATSRLVERHKMGICCPNEVRELKQFLWKLVRGGMRIEPPAHADSARFHYRTLTAELAEAFDAVCEEKGRR